MTELLELLCPYPTIRPEGTRRDGFLISQPRLCVRCTSLDCRSHEVSNDPNEAISHAVCSKGLSVVVLRFPEGPLICNGLIVKLHNLQSSSVTRKQNQSQKVSWEELLAWYKSMEDILPLVEDTAEKKAQEAVHGLHDVKTAVSLVTRNAEAIIAELPGRSDDDRIEGAPNNLKALLKSVQLLHTRLSLSSMLANPEAASHGQKHLTPIHKVCFKMVRLFAEVAARKNVRIRMVGESYASPRCFDSFETIPLVLIDNAVKYSDDGREITVSAQDQRDNVLVRVESHGPIVPESMRNEIFERGTRGPDSHRLVSRGSGLGLYIANVVAKAHGCEIRYDCLSVDRNGNTGKNVFWCEVPRDD